MTKDWRYSACIMPQCPEGGATLPLRRLRRPATGGPKKERMAIYEEDPFMCR